MLNCHQFSANCYHTASMNQSLLSWIVFISLVGISCCSVALIVIVTVNNGA